MKAKRAWKEYRRLSRLAEAGKVEAAEAGLRRLIPEDIEAKLTALCHSDLGVLLAARGETDQARQEFSLALEADAECEAAKANLQRLGDVLTFPPEPVVHSGPPRRKVAIVSLLFNWPSFGGGVMHTVGLGVALTKAGYEVKHFYAEYPEFGVGGMEAPYPLEREAIQFDAGCWKCEEIKGRFREAVDRFQPDVVLITDAWNFKPHLGLAMSGYPVLLRFDGEECLCPLNNCRFLAGPGGSFSQCQYHQLATPEVCRECLEQRGRRSGSLHQGEREVSGVGRPEYVGLLRQALWEAKTVLVNNPLIEAMLTPHARQVRVVPPGVDIARFPWKDDGGPERPAREPTQIFMAGVTEEPFKGFSVLHEVCAHLWQKRQDFRLVVTGKRVGEVDAFTRSTSWLSQEELPASYREADICIVPSLVQEGWTTVAIEAMAAGRPLIASKIGGLQFLVSDGGTGLLFEPGDGRALADCLEQLLDEPEERRRMGREARRQFEERGCWEAIIERHYRPLLDSLHKEESARDDTRSSAMLAKEV